MDQIDRYITENKLEEAMVLLNGILAAEPDNADALFRRGKIYWRLGNRSKATSDYAAAALADPDSPAVQALEQARDIENFFIPDLLNP